MGGILSGKFLFLLVVALIVLGPEKLPEAARAAGRLLAEFRRVTGGLQEEVRQAFEASDLAAPVQELRAARDGFREAATGLVTAPFTATRAPLAVAAAAAGEPAASVPSAPSSPVPVAALSGAGMAGDRSDLGLPPGDPSLN